MIQLPLKSYYIFASLALLAVVSCKNSCSKEKLEIKDPQAAVGGLDFSGLSKEQVTGFTKLLSDEICPCGCPKTFAQCLNNQEKCKVGDLLAQWALGHLKSGVSERELFQALSDEINKGFMSEPLKVKTEDAHHKGQITAPITVIEFADFECPACKLAAQSLGKVLKNHKDDIQVYFMHCPLNTHPHAEAAAVAAEAAARQNKFWDMHDALFAYEGPLSESAIQKLATNVFAAEELVKFKKDLLDPQLLTKVRAQKDYAMKELKLAGTPTFLFNSRLYNLSLAEDGFLLRIAMEKARTSINCQAHE